MVATPARNVTSNPPRHRPGQARLLSDVDGAGVIPLALAADDMRFPAAQSEPLLSPSDWKDLHVRTFPSGQQEAAIAAMGATPVITADLTAGMEDGAVDAAEVSWPLNLNLHVMNSAPYVTPNAALWPRTSVIFGNPESLAALTDDERGWLTEAASETVDWSVEHAGTGDQEMMEQACELGSRVAVASPSQLVTLRDAAEPVYEQLRTAADEAKTIDWIEGLAAEMPPASAPDGPFWMCIRRRRGTTAVNYHVTDQAWPGRPVPHGHLSIHDHGGLCGGHRRL